MSVFGGLQLINFMLNPCNLVLLAPIVSSGEHEHCLVFLTLFDFGVDLGDVIVLLGLLVPVPVPVMTPVLMPVLMPVLVPVLGSVPVLAPASPGLIFGIDHGGQFVQLFWLHSNSGYSYRRLQC